MKILQSVTVWLVISGLHCPSLKSITTLVGTKALESAIRKDAIIEGTWVGTWGTHELMAHILNRRFKGCHLLIMRENDNIDITPLLKTLEISDRPLTVVDTSVSSVVNASSEDVFTDKFFIGDPRISCRAGVIYLDKYTHDSLMSFLEGADFWKHPVMKIFTIGPRKRCQEFLLHHSLRNVIHSLYLVPLLRKEDENKKLSSGATGLRLYPTRGKRLYSSATNPEDHEGLDVYIHCFFCDNGESKVIFIERWERLRNWTAGENIFPDQFKNFNEHLVRVVTMPFLPFIDFTLDSDELMSTVTLKASLDRFLFKEISKRLNFTYEVRVPIDNEWARPLDNGSWTGMVGTLQREQADMSTCLAYDWARMQACDYSRRIAPDPMVILVGKRNLFLLIWPSSNLSLESYDTML